MKRHRILNIDFDARANLLNWEIKDSWEPEIKEMHVKNKALITSELIRDYGEGSADAKIKNFTDLGAAPFSVLAYHNTFFRQIRNAFVVGGYYPALTGACSLGERILNHLLIAHRDFFKASAEYKKVYRKESFDQWDLPITTLTSWGVLLPEAETAFRELKDIRNRSIHFNTETDHNDRPLALTAIQTLHRIIDGQFGANGPLPWFIPESQGTSFLKKEFESNPFIKTVYIPNCVLVGPYHKLEHSSNGWLVHDNYDYGNREISDEEFVQLFNDKTAHPDA